MILKSYKDALAIARQRGNEPAMWSLQREISRLYDDDLIAEMTALGPVEVIRRIRGGGARADLQRRRRKADI